MEKTRKIRTLNLVALIVAVIGLTIAFAALSKTLTINGTGSVDAASWDVHFENLKSACDGTGKIIQEPKIKNGTEIGDYIISLSKPGDDVGFVYDVVNSGTIDARVNNENFILNGKLLSDYESEEDALESIFEEADWDGDGVTTNAERAKTVEIIDINLFYMPSGCFNCSSDMDGYYVIPKGQRKTALTHFKYSDTASELPKGNVTIKLNLQFIFEQY